MAELFVQSSVTKSTLHFKGDAASRADADAFRRGAAPRRPLISSTIERATKENWGKRTILHVTLHTDRVRGAQVESPDDAKGLFSEFRLKVKVEDDRAARRSPQSDFSQLPNQRN